MQFCGEGILILRNEVKFMQKSKRFAGLNQLLAEDRQAMRLYQSLPEPVQEQLASRGEGINSLQSLEDYAQNLLRADD